jgi:hypothetical protein
MQNNRKVAETGVTDGGGTLISGRQPVSLRQKPVIACIFAKIPCSQGRDQFAPDCAHHQAFQELFCLRTSRCIALRRRFSPSA